MSLHATLNRYLSVVAIGAAVVVLAAAYIVFPSASTGCPPMPKQSYYSIDGGKTWFPDKINQLTPFTHDGKEAVRAHVYSCPEKGKFVGFFERHSPGVKAGPDGAIDATAGTQVKRPGETYWVDSRSPAAEDIV